MTDIPHLPLLSSLLYLRAPQRLAVAGRQLGGLWSFTHPVHGRLPVVSDPTLAAEVFVSHLRFAGYERFQNWLGVCNPFGPMPLDSRRVLLTHVDQLVTATSPRYHLEAALRPLAHEAGDVAPNLRSAALDWMLDAICQADLQSVQAAHAAAVTWQRSAQVLPLLVPSLRRWTSCYPEVAPSMLRLLGAISKTAPGRALDGKHGAYLAGAMMALLGPVVDALPMLTMAALAHRAPYIEHRIARALSAAHPVPLLILEARTYVELPRCQLLLDPDDMNGCSAGTHIAVDLPGAGLPFGVGALAETLRTVVTSFLSTALTVASELDLFAVEQPRTSRVRLCVGPTRLRMAKWPG